MPHLRDLAADHPFPSPATIRLGDIWRDPEVAYIPIRADHVADLRETFKPHLVGYPIVSRRDDGQVVVLNGSHRCEALRAMFGDDLELDVSLYECLTREQEVAIFERHHKKYLPPENRAKSAQDDTAAPIWSCDVDHTITAAPRQYAWLSKAIKGAGGQVVCVTASGPAQARNDLFDAIGFECDSVVIVDPKDDGSGKAEALEHLGAWFHFDNKIEFGPEIIKACPVAFQYFEPPGDDKPKKAAKQAQKALKGHGKRALRDRFHAEERVAPFRELRGEDLEASAEDDADWA